MYFNIKRYLHGLSTRRIWLLLILLPPLAYLVLSAIHADRFSVTRNISISKNSPVALGSTPMGDKPIGEIVSSPDDFFQNSFALRKLYTEFYAGTTMYRTDRQFRILIATVKNHMSMTIPTEDTVRITYHGKDQKIGETLVGYYSQRLIRKAEEGLARSKLRNSKTKVPFLMGGMEVERHRAFWRPERLLPVSLIFVVSLIGVMMILGMLEWADPSFKSERQVARYLGLPIIGSLPDLNKICAALDAERSI